MRYVLMTAVALTACTTSGKPSFQKSTVIERMGDRSETPEWVHGENAMVTEGGTVQFIYFMTVSGNSRPDACLKAVDLDSRTAALRYIKDNLTASGQLNEQSVVEDPSFESLTAFLSQGSLSGASIASRYWEKREESSESGERVLRMKCAVKLAVKRSDLERQLRQAMGLGGNQEVREKLVKAQTEFIDGLSKPKETESKREDQ